MNIFIIAYGHALNWYVCVRACACVGAGGGGGCGGVLGLFYLEFIVVAFFSSKMSGCMY